MTNDHQPSALRSLGLGACIGGGLVMLVWAVAGCSPAVRYSPGPTQVPPMPRTNPVILAVESQRSMVLTRTTALVAPADTNPITLTVRTSAPVSIAAAAPILKRGSLSLAWNRSPSPSVTGYRLYYGTNTGSYYASAVVGNITNATLTGLDEGTRYFIAAVAVDGLGTESNQSNEASGVTPIWIGSPQPYCWVVPAYGMVGKTNLMKASTNLTTWVTIWTWVGNGNAVFVMHTNQSQAWFRVEVKP